MGLMTLATNRKLEKEGIPVEFTPNADGTIPTLFVARTFRESAIYRKVFERISKPYKDELDAQSISEDDDLFIMTSVFAEVSVKGWKNVRLADGFGGIGKGDNGPDTDIEYTDENVGACLRALPDMFAQLAAISVDADKYRDGVLAGMAKN